MGAMSWLKVMEAADAAASPASAKAVIEVNTRAEPLRIREGAMRTQCQKDGAMTRNFKRPMRPILK